ncbi:MAG: hypothetical protein AB7N29_22740 [Vicinamibacterales bacterium]
MRLVLAVALAALIVTTGVAFQSAPSPTSPAIAKGVAFLRAELPKWRHNGDAARALLEAAARGYDVGSSLDETLNFLKQPAGWDQNKTPGGFNNQRLARLQFASALAVAERHGRAASTDLEAAAKLLVADQDANGSWPLDESQSLGSPATYGTILATWSARTSLIASGMQPDNFTIVQADRWLRGLTVESVFDASSLLLALDLTGDVMADGLRRNALSVVRTGQAANGGWGPDATTPPQVFDTALAVLALSALNVEPRIARSTYRPEELLEAIAKGKAFIESQQRPDGSWPETTRPAGQESYTERISTTGWALLALLAK